jgi:hypothetical protein
MIFPSGAHDLNPAPDGWIMTFAMKNYRAADEPNVGIWWAYTPRSVLFMTYPYSIIITIVPKHIWNTDIR